MLPYYSTKKIENSRTVLTKLAILSNETELALNPKVLRGQINANCEEYNQERKLKAPAYCKTSFGYSLTF